MAVEIMTVSDPLKWGRLIKAWATQKPMPGTAAAPPIPKDLADLKAQCQAIGLTINIPSYITDLKVIPGTKSTFTLRLPAAELVSEIEQDFASGRPYPLPSFYDDLYGHAATINDGQKQNLQAMRIGDYSIGMCA